MSETETETRFKVKPLVHGGSNKIDCEDELCTRKITMGSDYYLDLLNGVALCSDCGKCLRFARKRAVGRGEPIETAEV